MTLTIVQVSMLLSPFRSVDNIHTYINCPLSLRTNFDYKKLYFFERVLNKVEKRFMQEKTSKKMTKY